MNFYFSECRISSDKVALVEFACAFPLVRNPVTRTDTVCCISKKLGSAKTQRNQTTAATFLTTSFRFPFGLLTPPRFWT